MEEANALHSFERCYSGSTVEKVVLGLRVTLMNPGCPGFWGNDFLTLDVVQASTYSDCSQTSKPK